MACETNLSQMKIRSVTVFIKQIQYKTFNIYSNHTSGQLHYSPVSTPRHGMCGSCFQTRVVVWISLCRMTITGIPLLF